MPNFSQFSSARPQIIYLYGVLTNYELNTCLFEIHNIFFNFELLTFFFEYFLMKMGILGGPRSCYDICHFKIYNPPFYYYNLDREFNKSLFISLINVNQIQY